MKSVTLSNIGLILLNKSAAPVVILVMAPQAAVAKSQSAVATLTIVSATLSSPSLNAVPDLSAASKSIIIWAIPATKSSRLLPTPSGIISLILDPTCFIISIPILRMENSPWNIVLTLPAASSVIINPLANDSIAIAMFISVCPVAGGNTASNPPFMAWNIFDNAPNA